MYWTSTVRMLLSGYAYLVIMAVKVKVHILEEGGTYLENTSHIRPCILTNQSFNVGNACFCKVCIGKNRQELSRKSTCLCIIIAQQIIPIEFCISNE